MNNQLYLGTSKVDITPLHPVPLAGFTHRKGCFEGIMHRLYAKIWVFGQMDLQGKERRTLLVQADLIWWGSDRMPHIRRMLAERWGFDEASIILHGTHTHSGPQTSDRFTPSLGNPDSGYVEYLERQLAAGIETACGNMEPIAIERGIGHCQLGVYRRKHEEGMVRMAPNEDGPIDPELHVFRFLAGDRKVKGIMAHYACHPTTTGDNVISSEFPGVAMDIVESSTGPDTIVSFLQGCCGDIRPALVRDGNFYRGDDGDVFRLGRLLSNEILRVLRGNMNPVAQSKMWSLKRKVELPFRHIPERQTLEPLQQAEGIRGEWSRLLLNDPLRLNPTIPFEMTMVQLAEGLSFLAMDGEVVVDYGMFIKEQSGGSILPLPYSNGMIGYIPTAKQVAEGGYEGADSAYYFGLPDAFDASLEAIICKAVRDFVREKSDRFGRN